MDFDVEMIFVQLSDFFESAARIDELKHIAAVIVAIGNKRMGINLWVSLLRFIIYSLGGLDRVFNAIEKQE